jgi:hypothetical protein
MSAHRCRDGVLRAGCKVPSAVLRARCHVQCYVLGAKCRAGCSVPSAFVLDSGFCLLDSDGKQSPVNDLAA